MGLDAEIVRLRDTEGLGWSEIGRRIGMTRDKAERTYSRAKAPAANRSAPVSEMETVLDVPVRPFEVAVPKVDRPRKGKFRRAVLYGDTHYPFHDPRALAVVKSIIRDVEPDLLVDMGDLLDAYTISRYSKDPNRRVSLQDEINLGRTHLHEMAQLAPYADRVLLDSNHFARLMAVIHGMQGESRELARLDVFRQTMTWPHLLGLEQIGWRWIPEHLQAKTRLIPKMILKHGTVVRKGSAMSARGEYERYNRSGASGHTHRLGAFYHRDVEGGHAWFETGCTCAMDPDYIRDGHADWQQGCTVVTYTEDGSRFQVEQVFIQDGRAIWRDSDYQADAA
jgi:hypothetical protein